MDIKIRRYGSTQAVKPTILSYTDGALLEDDILDYGDLEAKGLVLSRYAHTINPDDARPEVLREDIRIIPPEELGDVQYVLADGALVLIRNMETGELDKAADSAIDETLEEYATSLAGAEENGADDEEFEMPVEMIGGSLDELLEAPWDEGFEDQDA